MTFGRWMIHPAADLFPEPSGDEYEALRADIAAHGQHEPIVIWRGQLLDGRTRLRACEELHIEPSIRTWEGDSPAEYAVSLNLHRRHLSASQRAAIAVDLLPLLEEEGDARRRSAAQRGNAKRWNAITEASDSVKSVEANLPQPSSHTAGSLDILELRAPQSRTLAARALGISERAVSEAKRIRSEAPESFARVKTGDLTVNRASEQLRKAKLAEERQAKLAAVPNELRCELHLGDFRQWDLPDESVDVVVTDPPYPEEYLPLLSDLSQFSARVLRPGGLLVAMLGQSYLPEALNRLGEAMTYHWLMAYLTPGGQAVQVWRRKVNTSWKPIIVFRKGEFMGPWFGDVATSATNDNDKDFHHWGQSESGMADILRRISEPGQVVCDPMAGGGTTGVVARLMGRHFVGCEIDPGAHATALERLGLQEEAEAA